MVNSALIGRPPLTDSDYWIVKGNQLLSGKTNLDPSKGLKIPPLRPSPDQYRFESRGPAIMAVSSVVIVIMFSVTMARFMLRKFIKELRFGLDDWLMVPALICGVKYSGNGKHIYDVTYHELYMNNWVCQHCSGRSRRTDGWIPLDRKFLQSHLLRRLGMFLPVAPAATAVQF
ncbi:MAG: hypothetical protein L6R38_003185 [Xanthoria sp. 2 TBL-2021]|nr:MAG: hypothetical protein L6R38_003185 [Xanthoria sp. 2 TBL-2021]